MKFRTTAARWSAATAVAGALLMSTAAVASAVEPSGRTSASPQAESIKTGRTREAMPNMAWAYRGVQGGNLCLLSRCSVGGSATGSNSGPSNTQGFNLCLLAICGIRP